MSSLHWALLRYILIAIAGDSTEEVEIIMPSFVEFDRQDSHATPDEPMFTLQRRGNISLNLATFKALGEPASVVLLYDADEGIIAMRKVPRTHHNGYSVRKQPNSRSYIVGAQGFTNYYKIPTGESRRFVGHRYDEQTVGFVVAEGKVVKSRGRTPKATVVNIHTTSQVSGQPASDGR